MTEKYDVIIVGTAFAGVFFLLRYLEHAKPDARVLVLERGARDSKAWQLEHRRTSSSAPEEVFVNRTPEKVWLTSPGFGGNSKCWWGGATRMMPGDFELRSRYGVGIDWPMSYADLDRHYDVAEEVMAVSSPPDSPMPRSHPFPLPPHRLSDPDLLLKKHFPDGWFHARDGACELRHADARCLLPHRPLRALSGRRQVHGPEWSCADLRRPRVSFRLNVPVETVETSASLATGVVYLNEGKPERADAPLVVQAASAMCNPHILLRSGITHPLLGKRLPEQMPVDVVLDLGGVKSYNGSTIVSGNGYLFYEGEHRRDYAACMDPDVERAIQLPERHLAQSAWPLDRACFPRVHV